MQDRTVEFRSQLWKERDLVLCQRALFFLLLICLALPDNPFALSGACPQFLASYSLIFHLWFLLPSRLIARDQTPCLSRPPFPIFVQFFPLACRRPFPLFLPCFVHCLRIPGCLPYPFRSLPLLFWALVPVCSFPSLGSWRWSPRRSRCTPSASSLPGCRQPRCGQLRKDGLLLLRGLDPFQFGQPWK